MSWRLPGVPSLFIFLCYCQVIHPELPTCSSRWDRLENHRNGKVSHALRVHQAINRYSLILATLCSTQHLACQVGNGIGNTSTNYFNLWNAFSTPEITRWYCIAVCAEFTVVFEERLSCCWPDVFSSCWQLLPCHGLVQPPHLIRCNILASRWYTINLYITSSSRCPTIQCSSNRWCRNTNWCRNTR